MKKNFRKPLSLLIGCVFVPSIMCGCANDSGAFIGNSETVLDPPAIYSEDIVDDKTPLESFFSGLDNMDVTNIDINHILTYPEEYSSDMQVLAAYKNIINHGLTIKDVKENLHRILVFSQVPKGLSLEEYYYAVGKLDGTCGGNPFVSYIELAKLIHTYECDEVHENNIYGIFSCDELMNEYNENYREIPIGEYLDSKLSGNTLYEYVKDEMTKYPDVDINELVRELEIMVVYGMLPPTDMEVKEWVSNFHFLLSTLRDDEILFEKYIPLAVDVHNAMYPDDQIVLGNTVNYIERVRK